MCYQTTIKRIEAYNDAEAASSGQNGESFPVIGNDKDCVFRIDDNDVTFKAALDALLDNAAEEKEASEYLRQMILDYTEKARTLGLSEIPDTDGVELINRFKYKYPTLS